VRRAAPCSPCACPLHDAPSLTVALRIAVAVVAMAAARYR